MDKSTLLDSITKVFEQSTGCKLDTSVFTTLDSELTLLAAYFKVTKTQAFFVSVVFNLNYKGSVVSFNNLLDCLGCVPSKLLEYAQDFESICNKGIFMKQRSSSDVNLAFSEDSFFVKRSITEAILRKKSVTSKGKKRVVTEISLLNKLFKLASYRNNGTISTSDLFRITKDIVSKNQQLPLLKMVSDLNLSDINQYLYVYLLWITLDCEESANAKLFADMVFDKTNDSIVFLQSIVSKNNELFKLRLIENSDAIVYRSTEIKLSDESAEMLKAFNIVVPYSGNQKYNIINLQEIVKKELYFNEEEQSQLNIINSLLDDVKFGEIQSKLKDNGQAQGIAVLFYGFPGTGKTESVYQIAKQTGREIMKVDISQSRSKWHGESEKIVKEIFSDYNSFASKSEKTPILLFNEADAILSFRATGKMSDISKSESNVQNIILEELENFKGIIFATTNIVTNLDMAFERRFLFKVEFGKPNLQIKSKIWKSKFPNLSDFDCNFLSQKFNFTGGQIDNILKKKEINRILSGSDVTIKTIIEFCENEQISKNQASKIGFMNGNYENEKRK